MSKGESTLRTIRQGAQKPTSDVEVASCRESGGKGGPWRTGGKESLRHHHPRGRQGKGAGTQSPSHTRENHACAKDTLQPAQLPQRVSGRPEGTKKAGLVGKMPAAHVPWPGTSPLTQQHAHNSTHHTHIFVLSNGCSWGIEAAGGNRALVSQPPFNQNHSYLCFMHYFYIKMLSEKKRLQS